MSCELLLRKVLPTLLTVILCNVYSIAHANTHTEKNIIDIAGSQLAIVFNGHFLPAEQQKLLRWITHVAQASTSVYGRPPLTTITIQFIPTRTAKEPVPFGRINRGKQQGISFYVNPKYPLDAFINDWTAYHEFSHLMIPYPGDDDMWFSEGLASYYQNIIMGRTGIRPPLEAWQRLYAGFVRGANDTKMQHLNLKQLSPKMQESRSFMRVYWSGAYYFFSVDVALRKQQQSLDQVLSQLQRCCLLSKRNWTALQLIKKMDQLSATTIFSREYTKVIQSTALQGFESQFKTIGLEITNGKITTRASGNNLHQTIIPPTPQ